MRFWLNPNERLILLYRGRPIQFQAVPHPGVPGVAHTMDGKQSTVYHLQEIGSDGAEYALKVLVSRRRGEELLEVCRFLSRLRDVPGLEGGNRICLTPENAAETIDRYPDLDLALLMPWLSGTTWSDAHAFHPKTQNLDRWMCLQLAMRLAEVLATLEKQQLSHANLSPQSVVVDLELDSPRVELLGLEHLYSPYLPALPDARRVPEYLHRADEKPGLSSHRFPGALLVAEILSWHAEEIKALFQTQSDSLFTADELHDPQNPKYCELRKMLDSHHPDLGDLMEQAWMSRRPEDAPPLQRWVEVIEHVGRTKIEYAWKRPPSPPRPARVARFWDAPPDSAQSPLASQAVGRAWNGGAE